MLLILSVDLYLKYIKEYLQLDISFNPHLPQVKNSYMVLTMTRDMQSNLMDLLTGFKTTGGIEAALVTSRSGVHLASLIPPKSNADTLAAMSSAMHNAADIISNQVNKGTPHRVVIECEHSKLVMTKAGEKAYFIVLASERVNLGPLFIKMDTTASKIEELFADFHSR